LRLVAVFPLSRLRSESTTSLESAARVEPLGLCRRPMFRPTSPLNVPGCLIDLFAPCQHGGSCASTSYRREVRNSVHRWHNSMGRGICKVRSLRQWGRLNTQIETKGPGGRGGGRRCACSNGPSPIRPPDWKTTFQCPCSSAYVGSSLRSQPTGRASPDPVRWAQGAPQSIALQPRARFCGLAAPLAALPLASRSRARVRVRVRVRTRIW